jgi:hypothetical protein
MTNLTVDIDFIAASGDVIAHSTQFVGFTGVYTALRRGVASITQDQREPFPPEQKMTPVDYMAFVEAHVSCGQAQLIMRQALIDNGGNISGPVNPSRYDSVLEYLQNSTIGSWGYMVLAGTNSSSNNEGAIIARKFLANETLTLRLGQITTWVPFDWALIQTNYNFWEPLPYPEFDPRRNVLSSWFGLQGQDRIASIDGLLTSLSIASNSSVNGVLNVGTVFTVIMIPENQTLRSYLRHATGCCA